MSPQTIAAEEQSIPHLFKELSQDVGLLVRQEAQLAKVEMQEKLGRITTDLVALAAAGVVALVGGLAITAAAILLLIDPVGLHPWLASLVVGALLALASAVMLRRGLRDLRRTDPAPRRTLENIREDLQSMKEHRP